MNLPLEYLDSIQRFGPVEAFLSCELGYLALWPLDKIDEYSHAYHVDEFAPSFYFFGSNGGGELLAFNASGEVFCIPAIGMGADDAIRVAASWTEFQGYIEIQQ